MKWIAETPKTVADVQRVLLQGNYMVVRMKSHGAKPLQQFLARVARRRGKMIALVALARKLLTTAYGVLKSGRAL